MLGAAAEQGSAIAMHNAAFLLRRGRGYSGADSHALALELLLRAAAIEHQYGDGLIDAADLVFYGGRSVRSACHELVQQGAAKLRCACLHAHALLRVVLGGPGQQTVHFDNSKEGCSLG